MILESKKCACCGIQCWDFYERPTNSGKFYCWSCDPAREPDPQLMAITRHMGGKTNTYEHMQWCLGSVHGN